MRHPLLDQKEVRKRVIEFISRGLSIRRAGNLIFVCGGNGANALRPQFCREFAELDSSFQIFQPEFAMKNYFSDTHGGQLDLADFEELIGDLSHAIVIFPEAPGSFAETGYFANVLALAQKTILALNVELQGSDSFIVMGPGRKFERNSNFAPNIYLNYDEPDFSKIFERINRIEYPRTLKLVEIRPDLPSYDLFCLTYEIVDLLSLASFEDIIYIYRGLTGAHAPEKRLRDIASVLVGSGYLQSIGSYGHYFATKLGKELVSLRTGYAETDLEIRLKIQELLRAGEPEFGELLTEKSHAY